MASVWVIHAPEEEFGAAELEEEQGREEDVIQDHKNQLAEELHSGVEISTAIQNLEIGTERTTNYIEETRKILMDHQSVFAHDDSNLQCIKGVEHRLELTDYTPLRQRPYKTDAKSQEIIDEIVVGLLENGIIEPSNSDWASPVLLVLKKDGSHRMCVDYRRVNKVLLKDQWPLPRIQDILDALGGAKVFSVLDLKSGFFQVRMAEESMKYTAFITKKGLFQYLYMPFGLATNPSAFSRVMHLVFMDMNWVEIIFYIDDVIIFAATVADHNRILLKFLLRCLQFHITLNLKKCEFLKDSVLYLGYIISDKGLQPNPKKVEIVKNHPTPVTKKQLQSFMGTINYYRRFIKDIAIITTPLNKLLRKNVRFVWSEECETAFRQLIEALVSEPILGFPDFTKDFLLQVDASKTSLGYVLSQIKDEEEAAIAFGGRSLNKHEVNYSVYEKEGLAVVSGIKYFHHYLYGRPFTVFCDNTAVTWLFAQKQPVGRICRWICSLMEYDFTIKYKQGRLNGNADGISRIPPVGAVEDSFMQRLAQGQGTDVMLGQLKEQLQLGNKLKGYVLDDNDVIWKVHHEGDAATDFKLAVPYAMRKEILTANHDSVLAGHGGVSKTYSRINKRYHWENLYKDVVAHCRKCHVCTYKKDVHHHKAPLNPVPVESPFEKVFLDLVGPLTPSNGYAYLIVFICALTKWIEVRPLVSSDAKEAAEAFFVSVVTTHGCCRTLITDRGTNFTAVLFSELCKLVQVEKLHVTASHPEGNGVVERVNGTIVKMLALFVNDHQDNWSELLPAVVFAYRTSYHHSIKMTPFEALFGRTALLPLDLEHYTMPRLPEEQLGRLNEYREKIGLMQDKAKTTYRDTQEKVKVRYDKNAKVKSFQPGDVVLLRIMKQKKGVSPKLADKFAGPFEVLAQLSEVNYRIRDINSNREDTVHTNRMKLLPDKQEEPEVTQDMVDELFGTSEGEEDFEGFSEVESSEDDSADANVVDAQPRRLPLQVRRGYTLFTLGVNICFMLMLCGFPLPASAGSPDIGSVYDCSLIRHEGLYTLPRDLVCEDFAKIERVHTFKAEVKHFKQTTQTINLYHCKQEQVTLACNEDFFGEEHKQLSIKPQKVSDGLCRQAVTSKITPYGMLVKRSSNTWISRDRKSFHCKWLRKEIVTFSRIRVTRYHGVVLNDNKVLEQDVTETECTVLDKSVPVEQLQSVIIWLYNARTNGTFSSHWAHIGLSS